MNKLFIRMATMLSVLAFMFIFAAPVAATADTGELSFGLETSSNSVKIKNTLDVTITLKNTTAFSITDLNFKFNYNSSYFGVYQEQGSATGKWTLSHKDTTLTSSGSSLIINYSATNSTSCRPIAPNETFSVSITMYAVNAGQNATSAQFSLSDATALMRTDVSSNIISESNLTHTFKFAPTYPTASVTINTYSDNASLTSLVPKVNNSEKALTPAFSPDVTEYRIMVLYDFPGVDIELTRADANATARLEAPNSYAVGDNTVKVIVTAENKVTTKTYTIIVQRLEPGQTIPASNDTTTASTEETTATTASESTETQETTEITNSPSGEDDEVGNQFIKEGGLETTVKLNLATLLGLIAGEIALFLLAFFSGYMTHKNAIKPDDITIDDLMAAQEKLANQKEELNSVENASDRQPQTDALPQPQEEPMPMQQQFAPASPPYAMGYQQEYNAGYGITEFDMNAQNGAYQQGFDEYSSGELDGYYSDESQPDELPYDEYGYNAQGESNYQQNGPSESIYYS